MPAAHQRWIFFLSLLFFLPFLQLEARASDPIIRDVVCEMNSSGHVRHCTQSEMKQMIQSLQIAKQEGDRLKSTLGSQAHQLGRFLLIIGGSWFVTSAIAASIDGQTHMAATRGLTSAIQTLIRLTGGASSQLSARWAEGFLFRGILIGFPMAAAGGFITLVTPSPTGAGTLTDYFLADQNFARFLDLPEAAMMELIHREPALGQKIVSVCSVATRIPK
jgi:hypothetical protein